MALCKNDIQESLNREISQKIAEGKSIEDINSSYGMQVVDENGDVKIPQELIDEYWEINKPKNIPTDRIEDVWNNIKNIQNKSGIKKLGDKEGYVDENGSPIKRITDVVKEFYSKQFKGSVEFTPEEQAENDIKAERGTQFHKDMESMFRLFIDPSTGKKNYSSREEKDAIDISEFEPTSNLTASFREEYISLIAGYVKDKLDTYSNYTRFLFETIVYNKNKKVAGTVDFIAIDGKGVDILDWKSIYKLSDEGKIYPTKKKGFNIQLSEYFNAIKQGADLSNDEFNEVRVIPILPKLNQNKEIASLSIGKVKPTNDPIGLLPVLSEKDVAYKGNIRKFLDSVNLILKRENQREARERGFKNAKDWELAQELEEAITQVAIQQNPEQLFVFIDDILSRANKYLSSVDEFNKDVKFSSDVDRVSFQEKLRDASTAINGLSNFLQFSTENLNEYIKTPENKSKINNYVVTIAEQKEKLLKTNSEFLSKIARSKGIEGIAKPQVEIGLLKKWTTFFRSNPATKAVQTFSKIFGDTANRITIEQEEAKYEFLQIRENLNKWAKNNNVKLEDVYKSFINEKSFTLKGKIDFQSFREERNKAFKQKASREEFIKNNYNVDEYNNALSKFLNNKYEEIDDKSFSENPDEDASIKTRKKESLKKKYDLPSSTVEQIEANKFLHSTDKITGKYIFLKEENWYSDFYKDISSTPEKLEFYNYITALTRRTKNTGLVSDELSNNFIPHILKGFLETGLDFKAQRDRYLTSIGTNPDNYQFGNINPITGLPEEKMFIPYTFDLTKVIDGKRDFSTLSIDLSRVFGALEQELIEVENKQNLESLFILLRDMEEANQVINVSRFGNPQYTDSNKTTLSTSSKGRDSENYKYLDKFGRLIIYGQNIQDLKDKLLPTPFKDKEGKTIHVSAIRTLQEIAGLARAGAFGGLNIVAPLRNFIMGRLSTIVQESPYFSSTISLKNYMGFLEEFKFDLTNKRHQKIAASLHYFLPNLLPTGQYLNKLDMNAGFQILTPENMFKLIQKSEEFTHIPIHLALMDNSTVRKGEIININQLVREEFKKKYNTTNLDRYKYLLPIADRNKIEKEIKQRISELQKTDSLWNYMKISEEGEMSIDGVDRNHPSVYKIRDITANIASKATGTVERNNASLAATSYMLRMLSMFRTWIPRTVQTRFGEFTPNNLDNSYDEGRMRSLFKTLSNYHEGKLKGFISLLSGFVGIQNKKAIIETIKDLYEKKTSELLTINKIDRQSDISEEEFTQLYLNNIKAAYNDLRATTTLLILVSAGILASAEGGDDDKNLKRTLQREISKYSQEFTFYYMPQSAFEIIKNPFPIVNYHSNVVQLFKQTVKLTYDYDEATPTKYLLKSIPLTNFFVSYLPLFNEDLAKQWNISINPSYLFNR